MDPLGTEVKEIRLGVLNRLPGELLLCGVALTSVDTSKPAIDRHFKTGHHAVASETGRPAPDDLLVRIHCGWVSGVAASRCSPVVPRHMRPPGTVQWEDSQIRGD